MYEFGFSEKDQIIELVKFLYDSSNGKLLEYFFIIDEIRRDELKKEKQILYGGLEDAMHNLSSYSSTLEKNPRKIKTLDKILFDESNGNIAFLIRIAKAYFPSGTYDGCSEKGIYFFNKFCKILLRHKEQYLNGESTEWAKQHDYYEYIKLVIKKHK
ncbi:MAG: hypothetical protein WC554_09720 [Clostridia bacterium]